MAIDVEFYRGNSADLADAPVTAGVFVYVEDTHRLYQGDGTKLIPVSNNVYVATVPSTGWSSGDKGYYVTVTVNGIRSTDNPIVDVILDGSTKELNQTKLNMWTLISSIETSDNTITLYAYDQAPTTSFNIQLKV